jgi:mannose-1-phosphate guanylyltransferase
MQLSSVADQWCLVLAGGDGARLQGLTREIAGAPIPKQYCRILGARSLLEMTLARSQLFAPAERTIVMINRSHRHVGSEQLHAIAPKNVIVQPCNRDTGPGLLFALLQFGQRVADAVVAVFPSDHFVGDDQAFIAHVRQAANLLAPHPDKVALLGVCPRHPEPGYGYIVPGRPVGTRHTATAFRVAAFHEKPEADLAGRLFAGGSLWNSFVMVFRLRRMLELLRAAMPDEFAALRAIGGDARRLARAYPRLAPWSFTAHFLTRIPQHLIVLPVGGVYWSDWGTREAVESTLQMLNAVPPWRASRPDSAA